MRLTNHASKRRLETQASSQAKRVRGELEGTGSIPRWGVLRVPWRAVVLDLDETVGSWGAASLAYKMFLKFAGSVPPVDMFVKGYLSLGGARPWLRELLQTLEEWKRVNRIDEVAIFTSASNLDGWVTFLEAVSYTHLTLPTKRIVEISVVAGSLKKKKKIVRSVV
eukprot:TRINITY_DN40_c0_g1_i3.p1 TRINITY_DN40_c0_g1~~TRINITY_DN40_c0_g1_i3.p1  ORF type:complete len:166 (+),score=31.15 TRINITY_DN40_c0_g1_i3:191-688(+)